MALSSPYAPPTSGSDKSMAAAIVGQATPCVLKLLLLGSASVGKTSLLLRFVVSEDGCVPVALRFAAFARSRLLVLVAGRPLRWQQPDDRRGPETQDPLGLPQTRRGTPALPLAPGMAARLLTRWLVRHSALRWAVRYRRTTRRSSSSPSRCRRGTRPALNGSAPSCHPCTRAAMVRARTTGACWR
jgi:hypothetical protein